jgi:small-conductance mechanosensitive channel
LDNVNGGIVGLAPCSVNQELSPRIGRYVAMAWLIGMIIALLIAGFVLWAGRRLASVIPMEPIIAQVVDVLIIIVAVAIVLFYVVIPLLNMLAGMHIPLPSPPR